MTPNPGSGAAIKQGCTCPQMDNNWGAGIGKDEKGVTLFWYNSECPLHGNLLQEVQNAEPKDD